MRSLVLFGAWTLALSQFIFAAEAAQDVNPAGLIPLLSHKSATPASSLDPLEWYPDEPSAVPESSSSSSQSSSSYSQSSSSSASQSSASQSSSVSASASSSVGSSSASGSSSISVSSSSEEGIIAPASVALSVSTSASASASSGMTSRASTSSTQESACPDKTVSVETVAGDFCIKGSSICSGTNGEGECPGEQAGLLTGSHCAEVRSGVYGCRPGPKSAKSARAVRFRQ